MGLPTVVRDFWPPNALSIENSHLSFPSYGLRVPLPGDRRQSRSGAYLNAFVSRPKASQYCEMFLVFGYLFFDSRLGLNGVSARYDCNPQSIDRYINHLFDNRLEIPLWVHLDHRRTSGDENVSVLSNTNEDRIGIETLVGFCSLHQDSGDFRGVISNFSRKAPTREFCPFLSHIMQVGLVREFVSVGDSSGYINKITSRGRGGSSNANYDATNGTKAYFIDLFILDLSPNISNSVVGRQNDMVPGSDHNEGSTFALFRKDEKSNSQQRRHLRVLFSLHVYQYCSGSHRVEEDLRSVEMRITLARRIKHLRLIVSPVANGGVGLLFLQTS